MKCSSKILTHGVLVAVALLIYSMLALAIGAFLRYFHAASVVWVPIIVVLGLMAKRKFWPTWSVAIHVIAVGLSSSFVILVVIAATSSSPVSAFTVISRAGQLMGFYSVWFWLPFVIGVVIGGIAGK